MSEALPAHPAWFCFRTADAVDAPVHLGAFLPARPTAEQFVDLGPQDPQALLAQGALRTVQDLEQRAASGRLAYRMTMGSVGLSLDRGRIAESRGVE